MAISPHLQSSFCLYYCSRTFIQETERIGIKVQGILLSMCCIYSWQYPVHPYLWTFTQGPWYHCSKRLHRVINLPCKGFLQKQYSAPASVSYSPPIYGFVWQCWIQASICLSWNGELWIWSADFEKHIRRVDLLRCFDFFMTTHYWSWAFQREIFDEAFSFAQLGHVELKHFSVELSQIAKRICSCCPHR